MLAGSIVGAALVIAVLLFAQFGQSLTTENRYFAGYSFVGLLIVGVTIAVVLNTGSEDGNGPVERSTSGIALSDMARISEGLRNEQPIASGTASVASVPSLIDGLRSRLEANPGDARGWALLAQSYAFVGQADLAEQALDHAVGLGFDEADLRNRVASAERSPHAGMTGVTGLQ